MTYANEWDPFAAAWLVRVLPGTAVDRRSIRDVAPDDVRGWTRAHFFAGIGGWELALRWAGWPAGRPVWTGSCPCQPFSNAGKHRGTKDERHMWPEMLRLITECRPPTIFGEQVASADGRLWLAGVRTDLEALGYAVGAADLCAAGVGAPHIRQRLYWVAHTLPAGRPTRVSEPGNGQTSRGGATGGVGHPNGTKREACHVQPIRAEARSERATQPSFQSGGLANTTSAQRKGRAVRGISEQETQQMPSARSAVGGLADMHQPGLAGRGGVPAGSGADERPTWARCWDDAYIVPCTDGKARRVGSGVFPLALGVPSRVGRLRAYGNAIVPALAAEFVSAFMETAA